MGAWKCGAPGRAGPVAGQKKRSPAPPCGAVGCGYFSLGPIYPGANTTQGLLRIDASMQNRAGGTYAVGRIGVYIVFLHFCFTGLGCYMLTFCNFFSCRVTGRPEFYAKTII